MGHHFDHVRVHCARRNVIDAVRTIRQCPLRHRGMEGVDADGGFGQPGEQAFQNWGNPVPFRIRANLHRTWSRALAAEVEDVGALQDHVDAHFHGGIALHTAVRMKGVRGGIENAHHGRPVEGQGKRGGHGAKLGFLLER